MSARSHPLTSIDQLRLAVKAGEGFNSSTSLLTHLMDEQGDVLVKIVRDATLQVDKIEDELLVGALQKNAQNLVN